MRVSLQQPAERFAEQFPQTVQAISTLHEAGARVALSSSRLTHMVAQATGRVLFRRPDDTDLLIPHEDLGLAASLLGGKVVLDKHPEIPTADGHMARFVADELVSEADTIIQMVCPTTPVRVGDRFYSTAYTERAAAERDIYETTEGFVPVATTDALFLYGVLQRATGVKNDRHNASILRSSNCLDTSYAALRADEMWLDDRALEFVYGVGSLAVPRSPLHVAA